MELSPITPRERERERERELSVRRSRPIDATKSEASCQFFNDCDLS